MMEMNKYTHKFKSQIISQREKVLYTYVTHNKKIFLLRLLQSIIDVFEILLTAFTTIGVFSVIIKDENTWLILSGIAAAFSLALNLFSKAAHLPDLTQAHSRTSDQLWLIVQQYESLVTDLEILTQEGAIAERDRLLDATSKIYDGAPRTGRMSYHLAKRAIQKEGEQSSSIEEYSE